MSGNARVPIRVGPAGWQYPDWNGVVYPQKRRRDFDALDYIATYFDLVEINSTFYRLPAVETSRRWAERVAPHPDFRFTLKTHQTFTHDARLPDRRGFSAFHKCVAPLHESGKLACVLVQYPWSFKYSGAALERVRDTLSRLAPLATAVEVRHGSWENRDARATIADAGATLCGIDQPVIGNSIRPTGGVPGPAGAYFRLHGRNHREWFRAGGNRDTRYDYLYREDELRPWVDTIRNTISAGSPAVAVLNNHFRGQAPANAFMMMSMIGGEKVPAPPSLRRRFPSLERFTTPGTYEAPWESGSLFDSGD